MQNKKILIFLPDGIGLRNFAYSNFYNVGQNENFEVTFWNNTPFNLTELSFKEIKIENSKSNVLTEVYKNARKEIELNLNIKKTKDKVYDSYRFPLPYKGIKKTVKSVAIRFLTFAYSTDKGLIKIREKISQLERKTLYYDQSIKTLQRENPAMVFCTNQRPLTAIAPILAAKDLGIPTAAFIYSWDNLPKAMMVIETDYYFVWSNHMKEELLFYYSYIKEENIFVTGTPQFEIHFDKEKLLSREEFFQQNEMDLTKKYVCFSGDDVVTSPDDPKYLEEAAVAIQKMNDKGFNLGIIFRRCPVDFSGRYDEVVKKYPDIIKTIDPLWKPFSSSWNTILPTKEDDYLLSNLAEHCEMVLNLGSSMVFDFVSHEKPCGYFRYNQKVQLDNTWDIFKCYRYVHFRSMPTENPVFFMDSPDLIPDAIEKALKENEQILINTRKWFEKINQHPPQFASQRIFEAIKKIVA
ncbi:UDP-glycosyltransferase [Flavobacterium pectinovorum]|uniref:UDP-glycosyltransferase n=1 Tax=Flavobacterium pectinovorum TaxID=29533 RepID=A0A502ERK4_9FLAO|nr:UDP-glycosyltransferase [Flavobacterium pectinovorum]TPG40127.1 UDP-glycosyltransferase [Flavobacterium pectinovorum]